MSYVGKCHLRLRRPSCVLILIGAGVIISIHAMLKSTYIPQARPAASQEQSSRGGEVERPPGPVYVLLLTYMRSGSSFTGDILQQATNAFYLFEPLRPFYAATKTTSTLIVSNTDNATILGARSIIRSWFTCDMHNIPNSHLLNGLGRGKATSKLSQCKTKRDDSGKDNSTALGECRSLIYELCTNSPVRIIKTIRMSMQETRALLEEFPNLKIIHLVRDPRGTLNSQRKKGKCSPSFGGNDGCTNLLCKRVENDVYAEEKIIADFPGRNLPVVYRDIANNPIKMARIMYNFTGQEFTLEAQRYIRSITETGHVDSERPQNSSEHIETWKSELSPDFIKLIENRCNYILKRYKFDITHN